MTTSYITILITIVIGLITYNYREAIVRLDKAHSRIDDVQKGLEEAVKKIQACHGTLMTKEQCEELRADERNDFASHHHEDGKVIIRKEVKKDG